MSTTQPVTHRDLRTLVIILGITLLHGLLYVFFIPPWQHYDEPTHFEVAWLTARNQSIPQASDIDLAIRREIAVSMREHEFFRDAGFEPPLEEQGNIWLGITQIGNQPLYYYLAALPIMILESQGVVAMLYGIRLISLLCLLVSVIACWGVVAELTPPEHHLRMWIPFAMALLPGYVDVMTAVNNDSLAACLAALMIWVSLRLIRRGFSLSILLSAFILAGLIFFAKETAYPVYLLLGVALLLMLARGRLAVLRVWIWGGLFIIVMAFFAWAIIPGDAAAWYRITDQELPTRVSDPKAVLGDHVFQLDTNAHFSPTWFPAAMFQPQLPIVPDHDQVYSLGVWAWSDATPSGTDPAAAKLSIGFGNNSFAKTFPLNKEPAFLAITGTLTTEQYKPFRVILSPVFRPDSGADHQLIHMDGVVLAQGEFPTEIPPEFDDSSGSSGVWGNQLFTNLVRNPSAEQSGLRFRPVVDKITQRLLPDGTQGSLVLASLLDGAGSRQYYASAAQWLLVTFWGRFGWGHVPLLYSPPVGMLAGYSAITALFTIAWGVRWMLKSRLRIQNYLSEALFLGLAFILPWISAYVRAPMYLGQVNLYLPVARYALAAIIPTILILNLGLLQTYAALDRRFSSRGWITIGAWVSGWVTYALYALISIWVFYG